MKSSRKRKSHYRRSTPVIRLHNNVRKMQRLADLIAERLGVFNAGDGDEVVKKCLTTATSVGHLVRVLDEQVEGLERSGFVPPPRPTSYQPQLGHHVRVLPKNKPRYEPTVTSLGMGVSVLDDLVVCSTLPGGIGVQHGQKTPFVVRKSHLAPAARE